MTEPAVRLANIDDAPAIAALFDQYRQFYEQPADAALALAFIEARVGRGESVILVAQDDERRFTGFCQLYPSFCSVAAARIFVLYDLFVDPACRRSGVARALMLAAHGFAAATDAARMDLSTAHTNTSAQRLYESLGWQRDNGFAVYSWTTPPRAIDPDA